MRGAKQIIHTVSCNLSGRRCNDAKGRVSHEPPRHPNQRSAAGARRLVRSIVAYLRLAKLGALPRSWTVVVVDPMLLIVDRGTFSMPQSHHARDDERTNDQGRRPRARLENRPAAAHSRRGSSPQNKDEKAKKYKTMEKNQTKKTRKENERNDTPKLDIDGIIVGRQAL